MNVCVDACVNWREIAGLRKGVLFQQRSWQTNSLLLSINTPSLSWCWSSFPPLSASLSIPGMADMVIIAESLQACGNTLVGVLRCLFLLQIMTCCYVSLYTCVVKHHFLGDTHIVSPFQHLPAWHSSDFYVNLSCIFTILKTCRSEQRHSHRQQHRWFMQWCASMQS